MDAVTSAIATGATPALKHTETVDRSAPAIDANVHVKKIDRKGLLAGVEEGVQLKHTETVHDASAPIIEADVKVKESARPALLAEIAKKHGDE